MILISLLMFILPIFILFYFVMVILKNKEDEVRSEDVFKQLYVHLVLFATLMMSIGGGVSIFMATADIISPSPYVQSFSEFKLTATTEYDEKGNEIHKNVNEKELKEEYDQMVKDEEARAVKNAKNQLIKSFGFIVIPFPIFLFFNRLRKKAE